MHKKTPKKQYGPIKAVLIVFLSLFLTIPIQAQFTITVNPDTLKSKCNTNNVKLVFIAKDSLWYVDFSQQNPQLKSMKNITGKPTTPALSPDGAYIAYITGVSGVPPLGSSSPNSIAWLCDVAGSSAPKQIANPGWSPRFDLSASSPTVVYATCGKNSPGLMDLWNGCGKVCAWENGAQQPSDVWAGGSLFGGMSYNGQWLCTADNNPAYMLDITNNADKPVMVHRLHWTNSKTNADTVFGLQACNPSISSSRVFFDAMMYLDIGNISTPGFHTKNLGAWDFHTRIFISRSTNAVARFYDMPSDPPVVSNVQNPGDVTAKSWESPRWSNNPYFASAALYLERSWGENTTDRNESIYLIDLKDSSYLKLVSISDTSASNTLSLEFPWLWVETPRNFDSLEDNQWLNRSLDVATRQQADNAVIVSGYEVFQSRGQIFSSRPLASVDFFNARGEVVGKVHPGLKKRCGIPRAISTSAVLFASCTFSDDKKCVVKLFNVKM